LKGQGKFMCMMQGLGDAMLKPIANTWNVKNARQDTSKLFSQGSPFYYKPNDANVVTEPSSIPQNSASSAMPAYVDGQQPMAQQQQVQPASMPRATTNRFSFNRGSLRIGDSTMNASDAGLNI